jgi:hypothetical protein
MPTTRLFAYNTGSPISGTTQVGSIAISESSLLNYSQNAGGVRWWNGPDEDLGYVITHTTPSGTQPNRDGVAAYIGFWRSSSKTENSLILLTNSLFRQNFTSGSDCKTYLNNNGYWVSWQISIDPDAQAFITAASITNSTQQSAIIDLVVGLKSDGIWTKMGVIYPFVGGNATSHTYNLKSASQYTLTFYGGWTHSSTGAQPNGTNAYAATGYADSDYGYNIHRAAYSRENINSTIAEMGVVDGYASGESGNVFFNQFQILTNAVGSQLGDSYSSAFHSGNRNALGLFVDSKLGTGVRGYDTSFYLNGSLLSTFNIGGGGGSFGPTGRPLYLSGLYRYFDNDGVMEESIDGFNNRQQSFISYGAGLTSTEVANLYTRVQAFQTTLGRQV